MSGISIANLVLIILILIILVCLSIVFYLVTKRIEIGVNNNSMDLETIKYYLKPTQTPKSQ